MTYAEAALWVDWSDLMVVPLALNKRSRECHIFQIQFMPQGRGGGFATPNLGGFLPETDGARLRRALGELELEHSNHTPSLCRPWRHLR